MMETLLKSIDNSVRTSQTPVSTVRLDNLIEGGTDGAGGIATGRTQASGHSTETRCTGDDIAPRSSMRDVMAILPDFDPLDKTFTSRQFVDRVESLMTAYGWSEAVVVNAVQSTLKFHAKVWVDAQKVFRTWPQFVSALLNDFPHTFSMADVHIDLMKSRQGKLEPSIDFYFRMLALGRKGKLDDRSIIRHTINGLIDENARRTLNAINFSKCSEFFTALSDMSSNVQCSSSESTFRQKDSKGGVAKGSSSDRVERGPTCFNCHERGHIAKNCSKPQKKPRCPQCNGFHSKEVECKSRAVRNIECQGDGICHIPVRLGGCELSAFMDTGSQCTLVKATVLDRLAGTHEECRLIITGMGGGKQTATKRCKTVLTIGDDDFPITVYAVHDALLPNDLLLGQDIFVNDEIELRVKEGKMTLETSQALNVDDRIPSGANVSMVRCDLEVEVRDQLESLLRENSKTFATGLDGIGKTELVTMKIELKNDKIVQQKPYRVPEAKKHVVAGMLDEMLANDNNAVHIGIFKSTAVSKKEGWWR